MPPKANNNKLVMKTLEDIKKQRKKPNTQGNIASRLAKETNHVLNRAGIH